MIAVKKEGILLNKSDLNFENAGVLNPAGFQEGKIIDVLYRPARKGNDSSIGYCQLSDLMAVAKRLSVPLLSTIEENESHGIEDPRLVKIEDFYYLTFTAYDGVNAMGALATSTNLLHFDRRGVIVPEFSFDKVF